MWSNDVFQHNGQSEVMKLLHNLDPASKADELSCNQALQRAAKKGHTGVVKLLISLEKSGYLEGLPLNLGDALRDATCHGHIKIVKMLWDLDRVDPIRKRCFLCSAAEYGHEDIMSFILSRGVKPDENNNAPLRFATLNGHVGIVKLLLELDPSHGVDPAVMNNLVICCAASLGHTEIVRLLLALPLSRGVDPSVSQNAPLCTSAAHGHTEVAQMLLELDPSRGVDPTAFENYSFRYAAQNGHTSILRLLLALPMSRGVDASVVDEDNNSPIQLAAKNGHTDIVKLLLQLDSSHGIDSLQCNKALQLASKWGHTDIVKLLLELDPSRGIDSVVCNNAFQNANKNHRRNVMILFLRLSPSRGVVLDHSLIDHIFYFRLLPAISDELFNTYDWIKDFNVRRVHELLQDCFDSFKRWCMRDGNFNRFPDYAKAIVRDYVHTRTRLYRKWKLPPNVLDITVSSLKWDKNW